MLLAEYLLGYVYFKNTKMMSACFIWKPKFYKMAYFFYVLQSCPQPTFYLKMEQSDAKSIILNRFLKLRQLRYLSTKNFCVAYFNSLYILSCIFLYQVITKHYLYMLTITLYTQGPRWQAWGRGHAPLSAPPLPPNILEFT